MAPSMMASPSLGGRPGRIITGVSGNHEAEAMGFIASAQRYTPNHWPLVVYALADNLTAHFRCLFRVEYRKPPALPASATGHPYDKRYLTNSAWKPLVILDSLRALPRNGILIYGDASTRFLRPLGGEVLHRLQVHGVVTRKTAGDVASYTHPATFKELGGGRALATYAGVGLVCGCVSVWRPSPLLLERVVEPWAWCGARDECIRPKGADGFKVSGRYQPGHSCRPGPLGHCHRGDQSVLSILLHDVFQGNASRYTDGELSKTINTERNSRSLPKGLVAKRRPNCV